MNYGASSNAAKGIQQSRGLDGKRVEMGEIGYFLAFGCELGKIG
jgi:hypothetical protein